MSKIYDLYGVAGMHLDKARSAVSDVLGVQFELHDSFYRGGDYYRAGGPSVREEHILVSGTLSSTTMKGYSPNRTTPTSRC